MAPAGPRSTLRGAFMGLADAVPGVSGGTVALILGIHPRLVATISSIDGSLARQATRLGSAEGRSAFAASWRERDLSFLVWLAIGIAAGVVLGAKLLVGPLETVPAIMAAAFLGLVLASIPEPLQRAHRGGAGFWTATVAALLAFAVTVAPGLGASSPWLLPFYGAIAVCAMILPGISGSFLLLLLGAYEPVLAAVAALDLGTLAPFILGAAVGLLAFSRLLKRLLADHGPLTYAAMVGLLVGSVGRLWPWRSEAGFAAGLPAAPAWADLHWILGAALLGALLGRGLCALAERP